MSHWNVAGAVGRSEDGRGVPQSWDQQRDILQVEVRRERQVEEVVGRIDARHRSKKMVTPAVRRDALAHLRVAF